jgi:phage terminase large subunit-like protein
VTASATSTRGFSTSSDDAGAADLRRAYKAAYKAGTAIGAELQLELREVCVLGSVVPLSPCGKYWFDADAADRVVDFFRRYLVHIKGELGGKPIDPMDWEQEEILRPLFGWKRWDGTRRYRQAWIEVPRKNDKTTLAAGISLYLTLADGEPGAEVYAAAADKEQARICFDIASAMVQSSPALLERCEIFRNTIVVSATFSKYAVLSADAFTKHGLNAHGVVVDEVHAQKTRDLIDVLHTSTGSRRQPLEAYITTAGHDKHTIAAEMHEHALRVRGDPTIDEALLVVIYAARPEDDWRSEETWRRANPGLGKSKKLDYMRQECNRAVQIPGYLNTFKRLDLNIWTEQASLWLPMDKWDLCLGQLELDRQGVKIDDLRAAAAALARGLQGGVAPAELERAAELVERTKKNADPVKGALALRESMRGQKCWGGLDLANTIDINAFDLIFTPGGMRLVIVPFFWIPEERLREREKVDRVPWAQWVKAGLVKVMPGATADYEMMRADIELFARQHQLEEVGVDRWNVLDIATKLENGPAAKLAKSRNQKLERFIFGIGQGYASMTAPCKALESAVVGLRLEHGAHPVLRWMASNVAAERDAADNIKPSKQASGEKIDGVSAALDGMARALVHQPRGSIDGWLNNPVTAG